MSEVWEGRHFGGATRIAVKLVAPNSDADHQDLEEALRNEVIAHARLDHPGIVRVLDFGAIGDELVARGCHPHTPYLVTELAPGGSLARAGFPLPLPQQRPLLLSILAALAHAHARGVVHRDLKPSNVLLSSRLPEGAPLLCDFGIASARRAAAAGELMWGGTPRFMAPEQVLGRVHDEGPHTDLYALGCLAYVIASGRAPFDGSPEQVRRMQVLEPPPEPPVALPDDYARWIATLLSKDPATRFSSAAHAARALASLDLERAPSPPSDPRARRRASSQTFRSLRPSRWPAPDFPAHYDAGPVPRWLAEQRDSRPLPVSSGLGLFGLRTVPLTGREREQAALFRCLADVASTRRARIVLVRGPAGVGKTRLGEWLCERVVELGIALPLATRFSAARAPSEGFAPLLARAIRAPTHGDPSERVREWISETGLPSQLDADDLLALLTEVDTRFPRPADRHAAIRRVLARLSERQPLVLHLDDAPRSTDALGFLEALQESEAPLAVLALVTSRDTDVIARARALARPPLGLDLHLAPLDTDAHARFVAELLGLEPALATEVARRTAGNPLFAVQIVSDWVARDALAEGERGFVLRPDVDLGAPDDLHAHLRVQLARTLARASPDERARARLRLSLELGALLGPLPDPLEWAGAAAAIDAALPSEAVPVLVHADLGVIRGGRFGFAHDLVRESLERSAIEGDRAVRLHAAIAEQLAQGGRDPERIASHYAAAGDLERALPFVLRTVVARLATSDFAAVHAWGERGQAMLDALGAGPADARRSDLDIACIEAFLNTSSFDLAETRITRVEARAQGDRTVLSRVEWARGIVLQKKGDVRGAHALFARAEHLASEDEHPLDLGRALFGRAECAKILGALPEARAAYERAAPLMAIAGENEGRVLSGMADLAIREGDVERAIELSHRTFALFSAAGMRYHLAIASNLLGDLERNRGRADVSRAHYEAAIETFASFGSHEVWIVRVNEALLDVTAREYARAETMLVEAEHGLTRAGRDGYANVARCVRLPCLAARGAYTIFDSVLDQIEPALDALVDPDVLLALERATTELAAAGEMARAERCGKHVERQRHLLARK
jgi:serine/threonine protein kinase/tetratricopeptide (TPR) repeat protein